VCVCVCVCTRVRNRVYALFVIASVFVSSLPTAPSNGRGSSGDEPLRSVSAASLPTYQLTPILHQYASSLYVLVFACTSVFGQDDFQLTRTHTILAVSFLLRCCLLCCLFFLTNLIYILFPRPERYVAPIVSRHAYFHTHVQAGLGAPPRKYSL